MKIKAVGCATIVAMVLQGCSSRPREFTPTIPAVDRAQFDLAYDECRQLLVAGKLNASGKAGSAAAGAAAGATTAAVGGSAAAVAGGYGGLAAASATIVLLPFAIVGGAWGMARMKRAKKERIIKAAMEGCLQERGYRVAGWSKTDKKAKILAPGTAAD